MLTSWNPEEVNKISIQNYPQDVPHGKRLFRNDLHGPVVKNGKKVKDSIRKGESDVFKTIGNRSIIFHVLIAPNEQR